MPTSSQPTELYPLTSLQETMVLSSMRSPRSGVYLLQGVWELAEELNVPLLGRAWRLMAQRHPILRTTITSDREGTLWQGVQENPEFSWQTLDWTALTPDERPERLAAFLRADRERPFTLDDGVPMRFAVMKTSESSYTLIWSVHHALIDGRSRLIAWQEWFALYEGLLAGEEVQLSDPVNFREHIDWLDRLDLAKAEQHWRELLAGLEQTTDYLVDRIGPIVAGEGIAREHARLSLELTQEVWDLARRHDVTVNTLVQGAWALLLSRHSGRTDIVFGVTRAGRQTSVEGADRIVGPLVNTLPVRVAVPADAPLLPWLKQIRQQWFVLREYEHTPLDRVWEWSGLPPGMPPFDTIVVYDNIPPEEVYTRLGGKWSNRTFRRLQRTETPLTLVVFGGPQLAVEISYDTSLFGSVTVAAIAGHFLTLLQSFVAQPDSNLGALKMLTASEEDRLIRETNQTGAPYPRDLCAHQLFEQQVMRTPANAAIDYPEGSISYQELNQRANRLARFLAERGAGPEDLIALCIDRSPEAIIALLAVLKTGAAFLPLDPNLPPARQQAMLDDARAKFIITRDGNAVGDVLNLNNLQSELAKQSGENLPCNAVPENAAYAIYTSGSTGKPKAVVLTHRALVNHTLAVAKVFGFMETDRRLQFASMGTDVFVAEVFNYLCCGATLVFCLNPQGNSIGEFLRLLEAQRITITGVSSTWWNEWAAALSMGRLELPPSLRAVISGMERVNPAVFRNWRRTVGNKVRWFNAYGPAETAPTAMIYEAGTSAWEGGSFVPIGKPIANTTAYVLDGAGLPVPVGVPGELYIGGEGVGLGYLNAPDLTAQKFLPDPFGKNPERPLYRTGDLAFTLPDGNFVFLGRADRQVKIRGFRVELEEIEAVLAEHPRVRQSAVVAAGKEGQERLVAYLTPHNGAAPAQDELRLHLSRRLPDHMLPAAIVTLSEMPLTASGKIDRQSLPPFEPQWLRTEQDFQEPSTPTEKRLAAMWQEVLGIERAGVTDNFFELGGDSLRSTQLILLIHEQFDKEMPLAVLLRAPTIARLASILDADGSLSDRAGTPFDGVISLQPRGSLHPFFCFTTTLGGPYCYRNLANELGRDQPFFLVSLRPDQSDVAVAELVRQAYDAIRSVRPHGPYLLGGFCRGGIVAFETARQLTAAGEEVRLVALFDTPAPGYPKLLRSRTSYWRQLPKLLFGDIKLREILPHLQMAGRLIRRKTVSQYVPKPAATPVVQFIAQEEPISTRVLEDPRLGWRDLCEGEFRVHNVNAAHMTMFSKPSAMEMAPILREAFQKANQPYAAAAGQVTSRLLR